MSNQKIKNLKNELEIIRQENNGLLSPEAVVNYAKNKNNELHKYFCWDNNAAAERYRLMQAAFLLRRIKITIIPNTKSKEIITVRTYVSLPRDRGEGCASYQHIEHVLSDDELKLKFIESIQDEINAFQKKLKTISELAAKKIEQVKNIVEKERLSVQNKIISSADRKTARA